MPLVVAENLHAFANRRSDDRAFDRLMVIDGRARHGADDRAARLTVVVAMMVVVMMMGCRKRASGRQKE